MKTTPALLALLCLASCASQYRQGSDDFHDAMFQLSRNPDHAQEIFAEADEHLQLALESGDLQPRQQVAAVSFRIRSLIETDRHEEARHLASYPPLGYDPGSPYEGDPLGLLLLRAHVFNPERAYAELLVGERRAGTPKARLHIAWEMVHALETMGKPQSMTEAVKICEQNAGRLDFDERKKKLGGS